MNTKLMLVLLLALILLPALASAKNDNKESYYQKSFCKKYSGKIEYRLKDRSRVDCLTKDYAVEVDFASSTKIMEGIGQSLYYGMMTGKKPFLLLIIEKQKEIKYYRRAQRIIKHYKLPIKLDYVTENKKVRLIMGRK